MSLFSRLAVVAILAFSGFAKLGRAETQRAAEDLGLAPSLARLVGKWLAIAEIAVAALMVPALTSRIGAALALALFLVFTVLIAWNLWQGRQPSCACFGEVSAGAISNLTLLRNLAFVALAALAFASSDGEGLVSRIAAEIAGQGLERTLAVAFLMQIALFAVVLRPSAPAPAPSDPGASRPTPEWLPGLPPGLRAPSFDLPSLDGVRVTLADLLERGRPVVLFFTSPNCRHCVALIPEIHKWQRDLAGRLTIVLLGQGTAARNRKETEEFEIRDVLLQGGSEVSEAYRVENTPSATIVGTDRRVASRLAVGAMAIRELIEAWSERTAIEAPAAVLSPPPPPDDVELVVGEAAPPFRLPALRGGNVDLADLSGSVAVLIFWSPTCPHCRSFAPRLVFREKDAGDGAAAMVFVASGTRALGETEKFASPYLLDEGGAVARAYGATGTPQAVLIDADSRVASLLVTGAANIEALLDRADTLSRAATRVTA